MKLFPTNLFSAGRNPSDSSIKNSKDDKAFASLMREESADWSRHVSNDTSMGHNEETHEAVSRPDQAAKSSRRKVENRDNPRKKKADSAEKASQEESNVSSASKTQESNEKAVTATEDTQQATATEDTVRNDAASADASTNESAETATTVSDNKVVEQATTATSDSDSVVASEITTSPLMQLAALVNLTIDTAESGSPITEGNPLVGATMLSPAALGGIEGLALSNEQAATTTVPLAELDLGDASKLVDLNPTVNGNASGEATANMQSELMQRVGMEMAQELDTKIVQAQKLTPQTVQQSTQVGENLTAQTGQQNSQTVTQPGQAMLGGSVFQELAQKSQHSQLFGLQNRAQDGPVSDSNSDISTSSELPEQFQNLKSVWTQSNRELSALQQSTDTVTTVTDVEQEGEAEIQGELSSVNTKAGRTNTGAQKPGLHRVQAQTANPQNAPITAEVAQEQSLEQRIELRTQNQNILMQEVAPTPEGHVPKLTEVVVNVDDELRVGIRTTGQEVAVSLDGNSRAIEEMRGIGPELQESLENLGFTLSEFTANEEELADQASQNNKAKNGESTSDSTVRSELGTIRQVRHGAQVDTIA